MAETPQFTHFDGAGNARMVNVSEKDETIRVAVAAGTIAMSPVAYEMVRQGTVKKGDVLGVARIAGIMAAKQVDRLIPLCHPLAITGADVAFPLTMRPAPSASKPRFRSPAAPEWRWRP